MCVIVEMDKIKLLFVVQGPLCFFRAGLGSQLSKKIQRISTDFSLGFPCGSAGKESACSAGDLGSIPGMGRSLEEVMATHSSILASRIP